jgi:DNA-binding GntR family transcriptional regulator
MAKTTPDQVPENGSSPSEAGFDVPRLSRNTLNEEVYEQLKQALITGRITPGSTMTIRSLAHSFGISIMPVREALRRLVAEHVLVMLPNRSVALPVFTRERFDEITRIRTALEGLAAEAGAAHIPAEDIDYMREMNRRMETSTPAERSHVLQWNREFHFCLYRHSRMPTLVKMVESLWLQVGPLLNIQQQTFVRERINVYVQHQKALRALKRRNPAHVRAAIVGDIEDAARIIRAGL